MFTTAYTLEITDRETTSTRSLHFAGGRALQSYLRCAYNTFADYYDIALSRPFGVSHGRYLCKVIRNLH